MSDNTDENVHMDDKTIVKKYEQLKSQIFRQYTIGCKVLRITKIVIAVLFVLFTVFSVAVSNGSSHKMMWLILWIVLIFLNVGAFLFADYCKYIIKSGVIAFLEEDDRVEFESDPMFLDEEEEDEE